MPMFLVLGINPSDEVLAHGRMAPTHIEIIGETLNQST
jgi:hypothetical protein